MILILFLGETPERRIHWLKPETANLAQWMLSFFYPANMFVFSAQEGYDKEMSIKIEVLCIFNALYYVKYQLSSVIGSDAPYNELRL